jgi:hypothetical protein
MKFLNLVCVCVCISASGAVKEVGKSDSGDDDFDNTSNPGDNIWDSNGAIFYWDFSRADNLRGNSNTVHYDFDQWTITNLQRNGGSLTIHLQTPQSGFGSGNLTGDWGQEDGSSQIDYPKKKPNYWFQDVVIVSSGNSLGTVSLDADNWSNFGAEDRWHAYESGGKVTLRYEGTYPAGYSPVPEPSTYLMVSGLLVLPFWRVCRGFRKRTSSKVLNEV